MVTSLKNILKIRLNFSYKYGILFVGGVVMNIDTNTMVSMTDANQNFSKVAKLVDLYDSAAVLKNNAPRYLILDFAQADSLQDSTD